MNYVQFYLKDSVYCDFEHKDFIDLLNQAKSGSDIALNEVIICCKRLIHKQCSTFKNQIMPEMLSNATLRMTSIINAYDHNKGLFVDYASRSIYNSCIDTIKQERKHNEQHQRTDFGKLIYHDDLYDYIDDIKHVEYFNILDLTYGITAHRLSIHNISTRENISIYEVKRRIKTALLHAKIIMDQK